ncbi:hypothetical protein [Nocardia concava]|uniref:hypothetical protein n=1 Tax=Nocardia concava TaxID=257281 RepID=UPI0012FCCDFC|nr:hypothetical protein [Nocardia concava]
MAFTVGDKVLPRIASESAEQALEVVAVHTDESGRQIVTVRNEAGNTSELLAGELVAV